MQLRPYQRKAAGKLAALLRSRTTVVAVAPTGSGKTVIGVATARAVRARRVVVLAHRFELLTQAAAHLQGAGVPAESIGFLTGRRVDGPSTYTLASIDMPIRRLRAALEQADLIIVDEAHRALAPKYARALACASGAMILGLTATPWRLDGRGLGGVFREIYVCATQAELVADRYIAQPVTYGLPREEAHALVRGVGKSAGDFAQGRLGSALSARGLVGRVVSEWERLALGRRTIVFAASRTHARTLQRRFLKAGHRFAYLDGATPAAERDKTLADLATGKVTGVVNVDVLIEGFDCPAVKCIVLARPTCSLTRYLQQVGRACRPTPDRKRPIVIDHAGNTWRFGLPEAEREWTLADVVGASEPGERETCRRCKVCGTMVAVGAEECSECGAAVSAERSERDLREQDAELKKLKALADEKAAALKRIQTLAKERNEPEGWAEKVFQEMFS